MHIFAEFNKPIRVNTFQVKESCNTPLSASQYTPAYVYIINNFEAP